jgi:hypothetical protein
LAWVKEFEVFLTSQIGRPFSWDVWVVSEQLSRLGMKRDETRSHVPASSNLIHGPETT